MSHSEWELLTIAEDIEEGDTISVEDEDGKNINMVFLGMGKKSVKLKDSEGTIRHFSPDSLEELDGYCVIVGKSEEEMSIREDD